MSGRPHRGHVPLLAGWLFADLLLALTLVFLGSERPAPVEGDESEEVTEATGSAEQEEPADGPEDVADGAGDTAEEPVDTTAPVPPGLEPKRYIMVWDDEATRAAVRSAATDAGAAIAVRDAVGRWLQDQGLATRRIGILLIFTNPGGESTSTALSADVAEVICQWFRGTLGLDEPAVGEGVDRCGTASSFVRTFFTPGAHGRLEIELWAYP